MGRGRGSAGGGGAKGRKNAQPGLSAAKGATPGSASDLRETPIRGGIPRFEISDWRERYGVVAGITGRGADASRGFDLGLWSAQPVGEVMDRWLAFRRGMGDFKAVVLGNQVHGVEVMRIDQGAGWIQVERIDGWVTTSPGILLTITVADCVPIYLVVPGRGLALLHAGWRGTAGGILGRGVEDLLAATSSDSSHVIMHCGIGICGKCYEVGSEVLVGCGVAAAGPGPWHLDLRDRLTEQARALGLARVTASPWCSAHDRSRFFSHRASAGKDGRMVAYIGAMKARPWSH